MPILTRETVSSTTNLQTPRAQMFSQIVFFALGALEVLLSFRFVLKLLGASQGSSFVTFIYGVSGIFIMPFEGIFRRAVTQGIETSAVMEPATIFAMIVYAVAAWGLVSLVTMILGESQD